MVSRVEIIVFIIYNPGIVSLSCLGKKRKVQNRKRSVFRGVDYSTKYAFSLNCFKS